ncbi:unnamed protein product [Rotaria sordida]|uniref:Glycoside hydrolase family 31 TIM barrel domain-containing protein n=1 Tax=Rotaria sordida TaxID=392033 RepID=A0A814H818_9BILA|nr:unnamed protein product [Rotaria sordida]CAF1183180.1 unnamed protein product [Rotaria sordida]
MSAERQVVQFDNWYSVQKVPETEFTWPHIFVVVIEYDDIDYFRNQMDFTWNSIRFKRLSEYVDWLHTQEMKFITILIQLLIPKNEIGVFTDRQKDDIWIK